MSTFLKVNKTFIQAGSWGPDWGSCYTPSCGTFQDTLGPPFSTSEPKYTSVLLLLGKIIAGGIVRTVCLVHLYSTVLFASHSLEGCNWQLLNIPILRHND